MNASWNCRTNEHLRAVCRARSRRRATGLAMRTALPVLLSLAPSVAALASTVCQQIHEHDALLLIDAQNCFIEQRPVRAGVVPRYDLASSAALLVDSETIGMGSLMVPGSSGVIDVMNDWIRFFAGNSHPERVYATLDFHPVEHCSFCDTHNGGIADLEYCVRGAYEDLTHLAPTFNASHRCRDPISQSAFEEGSYFQWPAHCVAGSAFARFDPYLELPDEATVVKLGVEVMLDSALGPAMACDGLRWPAMACGGLR